MNTELITLNECQNTGNIIHLYYNSISGCWNAFGISAFLLKELCKAKNITAIESYSKEYQMPTSFVIDVVDVLKNATIIKSVDSYYALEVEGKIEDYGSWASSLRKRMN